MAISGSQKALMQCRSGIARSGATRSGYISIVNAIVRIWNAGAFVDVSKHVVYNGWSMSLNINDELDTANIKLLPTLPFVPQLRSRVEIALGSSSNVEFAGVIVSQQRTRNPGPDPRFWYDVQCIDWLTVFDAHMIVADYPAQSVTTTILDIIARFTRGNFTTEGVAPAMPSVQAQAFINERPSTAMRRLTNLVGGGFYIDPQRRVRAWSASIPSPIQESTPQPLTDGLKSLKTFRMNEDASQQRTRVWVEGQRTSTRLAVPFWPVATSMQILSVPLVDAHVFDKSRVQRSDFARLGSMLTFPDGQNPAVDPAGNPPGTLTTATVAAGATVLPVADKLVFPTEGWIEAGGQTLSFQRDTIPGTPDELHLPPSPEYGSLQAPLSTGTQVVLLPFIVITGHDRLSTTDPSWPTQALVDVRAQPQGTAAVVVVKAQDDATAATIAARENSDGYYEHFLQDGRYSRDGALARAQAELANFALPLVSYEWETDDMNAEPGRMQHIALVNAGGPSAVTVDVRITNVDIVPIHSNHPPRRSVKATQVQPASVLDVWLDDPR